MQDDRARLAAELDGALARGAAGSRDRRRKPTASAGAMGAIAATCSRGAGRRRRGMSEERPMAQVTVTIAGRTYRIACDDGAGAASRRAGPASSTARSPGDARGLRRDRRHAAAPSWRAITARRRARRGRARASRRLEDDIAALEQPVASAEQPSDNAEIIAIGGGSTASGRRAAAARRAHASGLAAAGLATGRRSVCANRTRRGPRSLGPEFAPYIGTGRGCGVASRSTYPRGLIDPQGSCP